jgi:hypothetical protein
MIDKIIRCMIRHVASQSFKHSYVKTANHSRTQTATRTNGCFCSRLSTQSVGKSEV